MPYLNTLYSRILASDAVTCSNHPSCTDQRSSTKVTSKWTVILNRFKGFNAHNVPLQLAVNAKLGKSHLFHKKVESLADLGGRAGRAPPLRVQILSF